ncbi:MAG: adenosylmethionine--8-amino-7-oxononanoate transaminase [Chromatiales bacterium]|jgi:adenosylmethionine-8-amino-7-oxononanoate aminotransferase
MMSESDQAQIPDWLQFDRDHVWHPYSSMADANRSFPVVSTAGVRLQLADGRQLIDGMSSWWCAIHGYNHPVLNAAITGQLGDMAHVMFGGLTHEPAARLAAKLVELTPEPLQSVFFSDSGSVAVEVALKMAIQYWHSQQQPNKQHFLSIRGGYHGDTFAAMSVCDPVTGMHSLFAQSLAKQYFAERPTARFGESDVSADIASMEQLLGQHHNEIAAVILEPIVQGAGGMWFYSADYLRTVRQLCDRFDVLLIADEIATGFGRTGKLFACEHAGIAPDIMCLGKALTGGYLTLAATLTTTEIGHAISAAPPGVFMHGPTFMANPLACAVANASLDLLLQSDWSQVVRRIELQLKQGLSPCEQMPQVQDVRVLGAIGVVELKQPVNMAQVQPLFVDKGVWVRPFGRLMYLMPPFIISDGELSELTSAVCEIVDTLVP